MSRTVRRRRTRRALVDVPSHLLGPGRTMPSGLDAGARLFEWLDDRDLIGPLAGQVEGLALLVPGPPGETWEAFVARQETP